MGRKVVLLPLYWSKIRKTEAKIKVCQCIQFKSVTRVTLSSEQGGVLRFSH